jgi:LDH2 family malate/lactate/ureidoglycolate dehydrogenase
VDESKAAVDDLQRRLKGTPKAAGKTRVYIHEKKEYEETERGTREGISLNPKVAADLRDVAAELGVKYNLE